jgi:hypothetical protein
VRRFRLAMFLMVGCRFPHLAQPTTLVRSWRSMARTRDSRLVETDYSTRKSKPKPLATRGGRGAINTKKVIPTNQQTVLWLVTRRCSSPTAGRATWWRWIRRRTSCCGAGRQERDELLLFAGGRDCSREGKTLSKWSSAPTAEWLTVAPSDGEPVELVQDAFLPSPEPCIKDYKD